MKTITLELFRLRGAITQRLNAHDLEGVMSLGAPADEYAPEMEDLAALMAAGEAVTPEVVAKVWHKWFGDSQEEVTGEPEPATPAMVALAADLRDIQARAGSRQDSGI